MIITDGKNVMTLEELAKKICDRCDCYDESCPAAEYCRHGHNGMIHWLRKVLGNEQD